MAGVVENYSKFEVCAAVRFLQAEGASRSEVLRRSASVYGRNVSVCVLQLNADPEKQRGREY
jgi:hypothetical protein